MNEEKYYIARKDEDPPRVMVATRHDENGKLMIGSLPFKPGMIVERCGKKYQIDERGVQRRMK